jgi:hypothetical protein
MEGHTIQRLKDSRKTIIYKSLHIKRYKAIQALFVTIKFFKEKHEQINYSIKLYFLFFYSMRHPN